MRYLLLFLFSIGISAGFAQQNGVVNGQLLIQFKAKTNPTAVIRQFEADQNIGVHEFKCISPIVNVYLLEFTDLSVNLDRYARVFYSYDAVQTVQKNHYVTNRETIPTDALFSDQWYLKNTGADGGTIDADIDATDAWDITTGGLTTHADTIVVCVIEGSGVDISHEDLQGNLWKNYGEIPDDDIDNDGNGYIDDFHGWNVQTETGAVGSGSHGTRVCGMIGAKGNNGIGTSGVNWDVKMMIVKGQQASVESSVIEAYSYPLLMRKRYNETYGAEGAFVVATNASWGIDNGDPDDSPLWCAMYDSLGVYGILSVGATTNNDANVDIVGDLPTTCTSDYFIGVTMTNNTDTRAGAGYGSTSVDLAAPGSGVRLPIPGNSYASTNGTSFATPCVTGAIALAYSAPCPDFINLAKYDPQAAALQMKGYILDGVDERPALLGEVGTNGRLNVKNSINLMLAACETEACVAPYNMRIDEISDTSASIEWDGFTTDYVFTITQAGYPPVAIDVVGGTTISFDTLTPCTVYTFSIKANCGDGEFSIDSYSISFETDGCCKNPPLMVAGKTESALTVEWIDVLYASQYNLRFALAGTEEWEEITEVSSPIEINSLAACTEYDFQINTLCADSTRGYGETYTFRTAGCGACTEAEYCIPVSGDTRFEWIDSLSFAGYSIKTGDNNGRYVSESIIVALTPGETYPMRIRAGYSGSTFTERFSVYIDFNHDGEFSLIEDRVIDDFSASTVAVLEIPIPTTATIGVTKMRIGMKPLDDPDACATGAYYGEYEDYCVYIGSPAGITELENDITLYPNPVNDQFYLNSSQPIEEFTIFGTDGKLIYHQKGYNGEAIPTGTFAKGVYVIQLKTTQSTQLKKFIKS